jgi:hypothetical protein
MVGGYLILFGVAWAVPGLVLDPAEAVVDHLFVPAVRDSHVTDLTHEWVPWVIKTLAVEQSLVLALCFTVNVVQVKPAKWLSVRLVQFQGLNF